MTYTIGINGEIILDGTGYYVKPGSFHQKWPRTRKAIIRADGNESYVNLGPGKREWNMTILCKNDLLNYDGTPAPLDGQQYRDALKASFAKIATPLLYSDPQGNNANVHFDGYTETILDLKLQQVSLATGGAATESYEVTILLVEV